MRPFTVMDFAGGVADGYLSAPDNCSSHIDNFWIDEDGKLNVREGLNIFHPSIPGRDRVSGIYLGNEPYGSPFFFGLDAIQYINELDTFTGVVGPTGNPGAAGKTNSDLESLTLWKKQLIFATAPATTRPTRVYCSTFDSPAEYLAVTLGLPALASAPTATPSAGANTYIYAFHHYLEITDYDGTVFIEQGPITFVEVESAAAPNSSQIELTDIPTLANTSLTNYVVSTDLKIKVARTEASGTVFYYVTTLDNGETTYDDTMSDTTLVDQEVIYNNGDLLDYDPPVLGARFVTEVNDVFWYATERSLQHSIQGAPGACPDEYVTTIPQRIRGLSNNISFPILFTDRPVYRVEGLFDEFGDGGYELKEISKTAGCISHKSIVAIPGGLVWAGNGGFYFTDGYQVQRISNRISDRYQVWKNQSISGCFDSQKNMVYWTINSSDNAITSPNDSIAVLHLDFGVNANSVFTTFSSANNIFPTALAYSESYDVDETYRGRLLLGENRGYFLYQSPLVYTDPKIDLTVHPSEMREKAIIWRYESKGWDLGNSAISKYCSLLTAEFENETDIAVQFFTRPDDGGPWEWLSEMRQDGAILWDISEYPWDDPLDLVDHDWNSQRITEGRRHMPAETLRAVRRQMAMTNAKTWIDRSDDKGTAGIDGTLKYITLDTAANSWPGDCEDYEIAFGADIGENPITSDATFYTIQERVSDTVIKVYDPYSTLTTVAAQEWQMRGYRKFERTRLLSYSIHFEDEGTTQLPKRANTAFVNS